MEIQQLQYFLAIAQHESLTKAAEKLHTSQPSLSRNLRALEDELGTQLFDRVGRNIVLNSAGKIALERASSVLNAADAVKHDVDSFVNSQRFSVDVYTPVPMGDTEEVLIDFKRKNPDINLRIGSWHSVTLQTMHPSITFFASQIAHKGPNYLMLGEEQIDVAVPNDHPLAKRKTVELASLADEPFVRVLPSALYDITSSMFAEAGFHPKTAIEDQDYNRVLAYVANGFGITLAPNITWFGLWKDRITTIPISDVRQKRYLYLKWPENAILNSATLRFRDYIIDYFNTKYGFTCTL